MVCSPPLRARFGINCHQSTRCADTCRHCYTLSWHSQYRDHKRSTMEVALRSRGTPRIANALLRRVRDFAMVKGNGSINLEISKIALSALNIDSHGGSDGQQDIKYNN